MRLTAFGRLLAIWVALVPLVASAQPAGAVRIAVIGDYGDGSQAAADVAALVTSWQPDIVVTTGDNNYPDGAAETIDENVGQFYHEFIAPYTGAFGPGAASNRFFPSLGNHDWTTRSGSPAVPQAYLDYFALPAGPGQERYYDVVWGPVHLFVLDSDYREPDGVSSTSAQAAWLRQRLAESTARWKLVIMHEPPYTSGLYHGASRHMRWPFQEWGATAVLAGHEHLYERIVRDGFPYFVDGLGGSARYWFGLPVQGSQVRYGADSGAMLIEADAARITFQFMTRAGKQIDSYTLGAPPLRAAPSARTTPALLPAATPTAAPRTTDPIICRPGQQPMR